MTNYIQQALREMSANKSDVTLGAAVPLSQSISNQILDALNNSIIFANARRITMASNHEVVMGVLPTEGTGAHGRKLGLKPLRKQNGTKNDDIKSAPQFASMSVTLATFVKQSEILADERRKLKNQANAMQLLTERLSSDINPDIEQLGLFSDTADADEDYKKFDGIIKSARKVYGQDADSGGGLADYDVSKPSTLFASLLNTYDNRYRKKADMVFYVSTEVYDAYFNERLSNQTLELHESGQNLKYLGIKIVEADVLADDVPAILTHKDNIWYAVAEDDVVATYRNDIYGDTIDTVIHIAAGVEQEGATVVALNKAKPAV